MIVSSCLRTTRTGGSWPALCLPHLALVFLMLAVVGCSSDDPTAPEPAPSNVPTIPTISHPTDQLPATSDFLAVEQANLTNLRPNLAGLSAAALDKLDACVVLDFRLAPGARQIYTDGKPCFPEGLQFSESFDWYTFGQASFTWPFVYLGEFGGSHYYLSTTAARWMYADLNARCLGGHLASLSSQEESDFVRDGVEAIGTGTYWLGLTDWGRTNNDWIWTSGEPVTWTNWHAGEPNNDGGEQFLQALDDGTWNDTNLSVAYRYVVETDSLLTDPGPDPISCATFQNTPLFVEGLLGPTTPPVIERRLYWQKIFQVTVGAGSSYEHQHSYTHGTSETTGMSFGYSIGISVSAGWGFVSTEIETEFHQDFSHEVTINDEETFTKTYSAAAPEGKILVLALWQLRERYVITDGQGNDWSDPSYVLAEPLPYLDQGLEQEYLQTTLFDAK